MAGGNVPIRFNLQPRRLSGISIHSPEDIGALSLASVQEAFLPEHSRVEHPHLPCKVRESGRVGKLC